MVSTIQNRLLAVCLVVLGVLLLAAPACVHAEEEGISEERLNAVSQNCSTIKYALSQLQKADSRTRTYLGSAYEAISSKFINPLNLRLTRNGHESTALFAIQSSFSSSQTLFRDAYTAYMRELESLSAIDCQAHPQDFYRSLEATRKKRSELKEIVQQLNKLAEGQYQAVNDLKGEL